eukprot:gene18210-37025_t
MAAPASTNRISNSASLDITALGTTFRLPLDHFPAAEQNRLRSLWSRCRPEAGATVEAITPPPFTEPGDIANHFSRWLTHTAVNAGSMPMVSVHAAGVAIDGQSMVLVGAPGAGKSTLVTALGGRVGYLSDEAMGLVARPDGFDVFSFAKPVSFVGPDHKYDVDPDELGLGNGAHRLPLGALLLLRRSPTPTEARVRLVDWADAFDTIAAEILTSPLPADSYSTVLAALTCRGPAALEYYNANEQADEIAAVLTDHLHK